MTDPVGRFGIVDMGSNAIRMLILEAVPGGTVRLLENHRVPLRLGGEVFRSGRIAADTLTELVDAFRRFRATCDRLQVAHVRAIATAAVREARNRDQVLERIRTQTGIEVEVITGTQEALLLARAVRTVLPLTDGNSLLADLGGGSVEVVLLQQDQVTMADSYRLGSLRLLRAANEANGDGDLLDLLHRHVRGVEKRIAARLGGTRIDRCVATGGNVETLCDLAGGGTAAKKQGVDWLPLDDLERVVRELAAFSPVERTARWGLKPDRADTIVPAGVVYARLGRIAGQDGLLVPRVGIKDGLVQEVLAGHLAAFSAADHEDVVLASCRALGHRLRYEADHAETVLTLARQIFDQTLELHGLDRRARVLLEAAALLHDVGAAVANHGHHKHSHYLIRNSELVGLTDDEREQVALVARYHRRATPQPDHPEFGVLRRKDRLVVERLAALLRVADALDRQHAGIVAAVEVIVSGEAITLRPRLLPGQRSTLGLEQRAVAEKGDLLGELFQRTVKLQLPG